MAYVYSTSFADSRTNGTIIVTETAMICNEKQTNQTVFVLCASLAERLPELLRSKENAVNIAPTYAGRLPTVSFNNVMSAFSNILKLFLFLKHSFVTDGHKIQYIHITHQFT